MCAFIVAVLDQVLIHIKPPVGPSTPWIYHETAKVAVWSEASATWYQLVIKSVLTKFDYEFLSNDMI